MFNGVPDQFHQFIASRTSFPIPLSFPIHGSTSSSSSSPPPFPPFDPYPQSHLLLHHHQLHHHQPPPSAAPSSKNNEEIQDDKEEAAAADYGLLSTKLELEPMDPWSNDEVLALLRIRSSLENWFPDFTWEHVSRKLAELGFKRSAENCKEKFEEESRNFGCGGGGGIQLFNKNYRLFGELEEFCHGENNSQLSAEKTQSAEKPIDGEEEEEEDSRNVAEGNNEPKGKEEMAKESKKGRKRKRKKHRFEMFMGFCEAIVSKMMMQQEELHSKLLDDMVKRDEENIAREEAWKRREMDRINKEIEIREQEQAMSCDRQAKIIEFLKKFSSTNNRSSSSSDNTNLWFAEKIEGLQTTKISNPTMVITQQNPSSLLITHTNLNTHSPSTEALFVSPSSLLNSNRKSPTQLPSRLNSLTSGLPETEDVQLDYKLVDTSSTETLSPQNTITSTPDAITSKEPTTQAPSSHEPNNSHPISSPQKRIENPSRHERDDIGKRWPRDEVLALVNLRCSLYNNNEEKEGGANGNNNKGPLWERISQGMMELGYKRSAKRCKEKWENINKYFRKTKDVKKKRSLDSRTCPYFQQLSSLYGQGTHLVAPSDVPVNHPSLPENCSEMPETAQVGSSSEANADAAEGEKDAIQVPAFNF